MLKLGYKFMWEEHGPKELIKNGEQVERAGFDFAAISGHFFPWLDEQGHSPFARSVLCAIANATERLGLTTSVTCPSVRYHPAIIAQGDSDWQSFHAGFGLGGAAQRACCRRGLAPHRRAA